MSKAKLDHANQFPISVRATAYNSIFGDAMDDGKESNETDNNEN